SDSTCKFSVNEVAGGYELIGEFPATTPEQVTFFVSYDHYGAVKVHSDVSEFHYKLWGEEWEKPLGSLKGKIILPVENESKIQYWIHPGGYTQEVNVAKNIINLETGEIPSSQWYEIRAVFPRIEAPNPIFVQIDDAEGLKEILAIENEYQQRGSILRSIYNLAILFSLLILAFPFYIYFKYGREPKINYEAIYEREPPTDSKPAVVNAIMNGKMGIPTIDGFTATIMSLVNQGYISLRTVRSEESRALGLLKSESEDIILEIFERNSNELEDFEKDALNLLKSHSSDNKISWKKLKKELGKGTDFYDFITAWNKKVKSHTGIDKLFRAKGNTYVRAFSGVLLIISIAYFIIFSQFFPADEFPAASNLNILGILIGGFGFLMLIFSGSFERILGQWTPEGRLYYEKWNNFKKYLTDFSALKEHPPESIKLWDSYLVYATSLGVAQEVIHSMTLVVPAEQLQTSYFYPIHNYYPQFGSGFGSAYASSAPSGSGGGGVGGVGGGSGGGGGGAR
ncbi:MAG TPA: DUF2207 domain-containing protein, partial [Methanosarcina sp.]|nr:DUF2207 domain-containing protein [Methanosarcina sp.]